MTNKQAAEFEIQRSYLKTSIAYFSAYLELSKEGSHTATPGEADDVFLSLIKCYNASGYQPQLNVQTGEAE